MKINGFVSINETIPDEMYTGKAKEAMHNGSYFKDSAERIQLLEQALVWCSGARCFREELENEFQNSVGDLLRDNMWFTPSKMDAALGSERKATVVFKNWISVDDELPPERLKILAVYKNELGNSRIILAERYEKLSVECNCQDECDCDYDEQRGCYYMPPGWWEISENHDEFQLMLISEKITHWMFLPKAP